MGGGGEGRGKNQRDTLLPGAERRDFLKVDCQGLLLKDAVQREAV